jgi:hypothetical protein
MSFSLEKTTLSYHIARRAFFELPFAQTDVIVLPGLIIQGSHMLFLKKIGQSLTLKCFGALGLGIVAVTLITLELAQIGLDEEMHSDLADAQMLRFPENEDTLHAMGVRLLYTAEAARMEPAAGGE